MTNDDLSMDDMIAEANRRAKVAEDIEKRNKKRKAKGRAPLPDEQERKDLAVSRMRYRSGDATTVDSAEALKLFEMRKAAMIAGDDSDPDDDIETPAPAPAQTKPAKPDKPAKPAKPAEPSLKEAVEKAQREAEAVRRVQDMKNGRIDHISTWSGESPDVKLEGGDQTRIAGSMDSNGMWHVGGKIAGDTLEDAKDVPDVKVVKKAKGKPAGEWFEAFRADLYERLRVSFDGIERSLSDLQGRVAEIVTASAPKEAPAEAIDQKSEFEKLLSQKTQVTFDVGGTRMTFDAVTVFHAPPCITVVSKTGSATITPKPAARLKLTYSMDGERYVDDPVTFLGTRFELPMFGLSFVGFIRDNEADMMDVSNDVGQGAA